MEIVNGYVCNNCTDVASAKRFVDPAHPKDGSKAEEPKVGRGPAVTFGGELAKLQPQDQPRDVEAVRPSPYAPGSSVTLQA